MDLELGNNPFHDWESLPSSFSHNHHYHSSSSSSASSSSSSHNLLLTSPQSHPHPHHHNNNHLNNHHNHDQHISIFPPNNHEGLPVPPLPPPRAPPSFYSDSESLSPSSSPPPKTCVSHLTNCFHFALHLWNSKLYSYLTILRSRGFFSSFFPVAATASLLGFLCFWVFRQRSLPSHGGKESLEHLKLLIKEKDEKIIQLLEQIARMNKLLIARYRIPVLKAS